MPDEPPTSYDISAIIGTFYLASRGRAYISGMAVMPMPLSVTNITDVLVAHPVDLERELLDTCVFAIDDIWLAEDVKDDEKSDDDSDNTN